MKREGTKLLPGGGPPSSLVGRNGCSPSSETRQAKVFFIVCGKRLPNTIEKVPSGSPTSDTPGIVGLLTKLTLRTWASNFRSSIVGAIFQNNSNGTSTI